MNTIPLETLKTKVEETIQDCLDTERNKYGAMGNFPRIQYNLSGRTAGQAFLQENKIRLNQYLLEKYGQKFIERTVVHEMGHLIAYRVFNERGHGRVWRHVMNVLGGPTERCHTYETKPARIAKKSLCHCDKCGKEFNLTNYRVNKIRRNSNAYTHTGCGGKIMIGAAK